MRLFVISILFFLIKNISADLFLHNPKGSNNRCDEISKYVSNPYRLFNSNNNLKGGYSIPCNKPWNTSSTDINCYNMDYYSNSNIKIIWTSDTDCHKNKCSFIIQYSCDDDLGIGVRNGKPSLGIGNTCTKNIIDNSKSDNLGRHEQFEYYNTCKNTKRNLDLPFTYKIINDTSDFSINNKKGSKYGFECSEERDYYPYWNKSPWLDIAFLTNKNKKCDYYIKNSQCNKDIYQCVNEDSNISSITFEDCNLNNGTWQINKKNKCNPICKNYDYDNINKYYFYNWKLPNLNKRNCIIRIRQNITNSNFLKFNKSLLVTPHDVPLSLSYFSDYKFTIFQDRSFTFNIIQNSYNFYQKIHNVNIMGKRGNEFQISPSLEYSFIPSKINASVDDYIHFQWQESDYNELYLDGNGREGTDRNNLIELFGNKNNFFDNNTGSFFASRGQDFSNYSECYNYYDLLNYNTYKYTQNKKNCALLNNIKPYFNYNPIRINKTGEFYFTSSRNPRIQFFLNVTDSKDSFRLKDFTYFRKYILWFLFFYTPLFLLNNNRKVINSLI